MTLLAAWQVLMHRYSGQDDIVIGTPVANRDNPALEGVVGCLVNNIPVRSLLDGNPDFAAFLSQVRQTTLGAVDHRAIPFDRLVQALNPERSTSHAPIFQVLLHLDVVPDPVAGAGGNERGFFRAGQRRVPFRSHAGAESITEGDHVGQYRALYEFDSDLFVESTIVRLHDHFMNLLAALAADPSCGVRDIPAVEPRNNGNS